MINTNTRIVIVQLQQHLTSKQTNSIGREHVIGCICTSLSRKKSTNCSNNIIYLHQSLFSFIKATLRHSATSKHYKTFYSYLGTTKDHGECILQQFCSAPSSSVQSRILMTKACKDIINQSYRALLQNSMLHKTIQQQQLIFSFWQLANFTFQKLNSLSVACNCIVTTLGIKYTTK